MCRLRAAPTQPMGEFYILSSLFWLWVVEPTRPDHRDVIGAGIWLVEARVVLFGPRNA